MAPLGFTEDDVMWVISNLSSTAESLGAEAIELRNWHIFASDELRVVVVEMVDWITKPQPPPVNQQGR